MVEAAVGVLTEYPMGAGVCLFFCLPFAATDFSPFDRVVMGASFKFAMNPMEKGVWGLRWEERFLNRRQDWKEVSDRERCPRIAFIDVFPILLW
jgi:hypothetical protein